MIYLDNCSTTKMRSEVLEFMVQSLEDDFANPSSLHSRGYDVEKKIENSREIISNRLGVEKEEIYFTSGGTESNNLAVGMVVEKLKSRGNHIITTSMEHSSVLNYMKHLEEKGFEVTYLDADVNGSYDLEQLKKELRKDTILVSLMHVNNETGIIFELEGIKKLIEEKTEVGLLHVDGVQSFGKIDFSLKGLRIDLFSFSGHKVYGPKGVGGLYISNKNIFKPVNFGGNQERGIRSGTENSSGIIAFGKAVEIMYDNFEKENNHIKKIKEYFINSMKREIDEIKINGDILKTSPYIVNISILNIRAEVLLHYLADEDIYISTSSACSSNDTIKSPVLKSIGLTDKEIEGTIRVCFSYETTKDDIDYAVDKIKKYVKDIREIMMR